MGLPRLDRQSRYLLGQARFLLSRSPQLAPTHLESPPMECHYHCHSNLSPKDQLTLLLACLPSPPIAPPPLVQDLQQVDFQSANLLAHLLKVSQCSQTGPTLNDLPSQDYLSMGPLQRWVRYPG